MGGRRLTGGQAVQALEQAIDILRQLWDVGQRRGVRVEGEFYRVAGAKRGPAPAHHVGIWVGAGRSPSDIRRLLNVSGRFARVGQGRLHGPPQQWAEELAEIALRDGLSTFILASDDAENLRRYAAEVVPAVRELVAAEQ